jgi:hypothetical protein
LSWAMIFWQVWQLERWYILFIKLYVLRDTL